jgi:hypothetical protein
MRRCQSGVVPHRGSGWARAYLLSMPSALPRPAGIKPLPALQTAAFAAVLLLLLMRRLPRAIEAVLQALADSPRSVQPLRRAGRAGYVLRAALTAVLTAVVTAVAVTAVLTAVLTAVFTAVLLLLC